MLTLSVAFVVLTAVPIFLLYATLNLVKVMPEIGTSRRGGWR